MLLFGSATQTLPIDRGEGINLSNLAASELSLLQVSVFKATAKVTIFVKRPIQVAVALLLHASLVSFVERENEIKHSLSPTEELKKVNDLRRA